jgi:hypothetical protein
MFHNSFATPISLNGLGFAGSLKLSTMKAADTAPMGRLM